MPEVTGAACKFDGNLSPAAPFRIDVYDAALAFFLGKAVDDGHLLAELYSRLHIKESTI
jgi:hypothetical protein